MSFFEDKESGTNGEKLVSEYLVGKGYAVEFIGQDLGRWRSKENAGDYIAPDIKVTSHKAGGDKWLVGKTLEVKTSKSAVHTGFFHVEILSNIGSGRQGWAHSTNADFLGFLSEGDGLFCIVPVSEIRRKLVESWHRFKTCRIPDGFITQITLQVPIEEMKAISKWHGNIF